MLPIPCPHAGGKRQGIAPLPHVGKQVLPDSLRHEAARKSFSMQAMKACCPGQHLVHASHHGIIWGGLFPSPLRVHCLEITVSPEAEPSPSLQRKAMKKKELSTPSTDRPPPARWPVFWSLRPGSSLQQGGRDFRLRSDPPRPRPWLPCIVPRAFPLF